MTARLRANGITFPPYGRDVPLLAPHLSLVGDDATYLGSPLEVSASVLAALKRCNGQRCFSEYDAPIQKNLVHAISLGLVCWVSAEAPTAQPANAVLVISPHPDDAVLSLGSWLSDNAPASIANVFSVETWARQSYYLHRPELTKQLLVQEDRTASRMIGAFAAYLGFADAPLRGRGNFILDEGLQGDQLGEPEVLADVREALSPHITRCSALFAPAGVGGHIDHLICREAVLQFVEDGLLPLDKVRFYEELPYAAFGAGGRARERLGLWCRDQGFADLSTVVLSASELARSNKADALTCYRLQLTEGMLRRVMAHGDRLSEGFFAEQVLALGATGRS